MQFIVISEQLRAALLAIILGAVFAAVYDAVRVVRMLLCASETKKLRFCERIPKLRSRTGAVGERLQMLFANICDVLYSIFVAAAFCVFLYQANNGRFRWYLLFGCIIGFVLYRLSVGIVIHSALGYITAVIRTVLGFCLYLITRPAVLSCRGIKRALRPIGESLERRAKIRNTEKIRKSLQNEVKI